MFHLLWNITIWPIKSMLKFLDFLFWGGGFFFGFLRSLLKSK